MSRDYLIYCRGIQALCAVKNLDVALRLRGFVDRLRDVNIILLVSLSSSGMTLKGQSSVNVCIQMSSEMVMVLMLTIGVAKLNGTDGVFRIGAVFQPRNFADWSRVFHETVSLTNQEKTRGIRVDGVTFPLLKNHPQSILTCVCDAVVRDNLSAVVAFGSQELINMVTLVTGNMRLPLVAFNTERKSVYAKVSHRGICSR